jgi:glycosyltransferase involved in cell wall biosynthesis
MSNQNVVLLLDFKGNVTSAKSDARNRHMIYGQRLENLSKETPLKFVVISRGNLSKSDSSDLIDFHEIKCSKINFLRFIVLGNSIIRKNEYLTRVVVCSDPWESFLIGKFFQMIIKPKSKLQLQVHADISDEKWKSANFANLFRSILQRYTFNHCDQIRVVSRNLQVYINSISKNKNIVNVPIPMIIPQKEIKKSPVRTKPIKIGFFGRIQKDRGTDLLLSLISKLNSERRDFELFIAGKGSEESELRRNLQKTIGERRSHFLGHLSQNEVWESLSELDVYLSLAPAESYGLGMREAIISGVPVIAVKSNGAIDAKSIFGEQKVKIIDPSISGAFLSKVIDEVLANGSDQGFTQEIREQNLIYVDTLIKSWVHLARSSKGEEI